MSAYPNLFRPGRIGTMQLRNRLLMCPMGEGLANSDGTISERQIEYYGARARGGVGMVIIGSAVVAYPRAAFAANMTAISERSYLPGLAALAARIHEHGARIAAQLVHDGQYAIEDVIAGRPLLVPSQPQPLEPDRFAAMITSEEAQAREAPFKSPTAKLEYKTADEDDLAWVVWRFAAAARIAREAGLDGVEIHAGHGYLIDSFLSPAMNRREDRWGGTTENRARLLCKIIGAIRAEVGTDFPVWCRLNAMELFITGGETLAGAIATAKLAVAAGLDAIHVTINANPAMGITATAGHTPNVPGALLDYAAAIKAQVSVPVIAFGRLEPEAAEAALADGKADFIAMGRKLLADPDLPSKLAAGQAEDVRPCAYQYRCIGNLYFRGHVSCDVNPATGREAEIEATARPNGSRRVLVVGGGPAGMEAARLLALAGDRPTLVDEGEKLGGMLAVGAEADPDLEPLLSWLRRQVDRADINIRLGQRADSALLDELRPDAIILAVGARWAKPAVTGGDLSLVHLAHDLSWSRIRAERVVVIGGGKAGLSIAVNLAGRGVKVTVLERRPVPAPDLSPPARALWLHRLEGLGAEFIRDARIDAITPQGVRFFVDDRERFAGAALIVAADELRPASDPFAGLRLTVPIRQVGECAGDRFIRGAMESAAAAVRGLA